MRAETIALLNVADSIENYGREQFLKDCEKLIDQKRFYSCEELSERYDVSIQTLKNWEEQKKLVPDLRIGKGCVRYSAFVIEQFERNHNPEKGK